MKTLGEKRIGDFNNTKNDIVSETKEKARAFIDFINTQIGNEDIPEEFKGEVNRLKSLAMTCVEEASMWAVKAHLHYKF